VIAAEWFTRRSPHEDLSLLDEIGRGEEEAGAPGGSSIVAAWAWEASHRWLSRNADAWADGEHGLGADMAPLSFDGNGNAVYDMPQAIVGLQHVSGHALKSFRGLREGMNVLTGS
jgi:hypothetical protein